MTLEKPLPRFVRAKVVAGETRFYWELPTYYKKLGCTLHIDYRKQTALGGDYEKACASASTLNGLFDEWDRGRLGEPPQPKLDVKVGTVDWLFRIYKASNDWKESVPHAPRQTMSARCISYAISAARAESASAIA